MDIDGRNILVLGGGGMVGMAVCRLLLARNPERIVVVSRRGDGARDAVDELSREFPDTVTRLVAASGDVFLRADWQGGGTVTRASVLDDPKTRRRLIADILDPLSAEIVEASLLFRLITGTAPDPPGPPADIVIDCMNTATAVSYQDIFSSARDLADLAASDAPPSDWSGQVEAHLAALYIPQLVRHVQLLNEALVRAGTRAYLKVGTSGTGGMGFNIPYTHGEEKPSRLLLSKAAVAGAHSLLIFLLARTPGGPEIVKEIKPTALIGWRAIGHGPIRRGGRPIVLHDCPPERAVPAHDQASLVAEGPFGQSTGEPLEGVYIDTGENGLFSAAEFASITALGQMRLITPEEVAEHVVRELAGGNTGRDVVAALDAAVAGPTYRGGTLRQAALDRLARLEREHGEAVAYEILGPPRLSKLLYEAHLLKRACGSLEAVEQAAPDALAARLERLVSEEAALRRRIVSIGIAILLSDGERLLRGPVMKSRDAEHGWVDLTAENMRRWQERAKAVRAATGAGADGDTSSRSDRDLTSRHGAASGDDFFDIGEIVGWIFTVEDKGRRCKD